MTDGMGSERASGAGESRQIGLPILCCLALLIGVVTGFGAVLFRDLIGLIHNIFFLGRFVVAYDASVFTPPSPWGWMIIFVPVIGGLIVTFLVSNFAPEAKGHGVPEVIDAIYYKKGIIRPIVAVVKSLASAVSIGSGGAVGREGPIIQIGSALGSTLGQIVRMSSSQRVVLVAAGAGAGIAATFNTPIGGVLFAIELMMPEMSIASFLPVALATSAATFVGRFFFGVAPAFSVPVLAPLSIDMTSALMLGIYLVLGAVIGLGAVAMIRGLHLFEDVFDKIKQPYLRHATGMFLVGLLIYALQQAYGHYYVEGVGYSTIQEILSGGLSAPGLLLLLFVCKLFATSASLGSGASGGVFSPALFMGATIGAAFAALVNALGLPIAVHPASFAMVGMGAMVGGTTGAAMTAVTMIFEMTRNYEIVLPMILAVAMSIGVRRLLSRESIYTAKLVGRGHVIPQSRHANMFLVRYARDVMEADIVIASADSGFDELVARPDNRGRLRYVVVTDGPYILGVMRVNTGLPRALSAVEPETPLRTLANRNFTVVRETDAMFDVIRRLWRRNAAMAIVFRGTGVPRPGNVVGIISREHVGDSVAQSLEVYPAGG